MQATPARRDGNLPSIRAILVPHPGLQFSRPCAEASVGFTLDRAELRAAQDAQPLTSWFPCVLALPAVRELPDWTHLTVEDRV